MTCLEPCRGAPAERSEITAGALGRASAFYLCACHVFGIVMSFHLSPSHQFSFQFLASEGGGAQAARCHGEGSVTSLAALHLTNGLLLSPCEVPCSGANAS